jgi:signal transduction histidine kinase
VLALLVASCALPQLVYWARQPDGGLTVRLLFTALMVAPLVWRRRYPLTVFAFTVMVALVQWSANVTLAADVALLVYLYTVASRYPLRVGVLAAAVVEIGVVLAAVRWDLAASLGQPWLVSLLLLSAPVVAALLLGVSVRIRRQSLADLTERADRLERERDQEAAIAVAAERNRIAREMHDVVAHSLAVMVTLSDAAALKLAVEPERAALAMREVSATGHQALDEMRGLLGVLRTAHDHAGLQPQPGIADVGALVDQVLATGLTAELSVTGSASVLPPGAELTVYRIVQEAITNVLKHAQAPTRITVDIDLREVAITVDVRDDGVTDGRVVAMQGMGLAGMCERVSVHGGTVSAGPDPAGGWRIHAVVPLATGRSTHVVETEPAR